jgi:acetylornithine/succinyldiaminopimelate/putrescine aminotransferase
MSTDPESRGGFGPYLEGVGPCYLDNKEARSIRYGVISDLERAFELFGERVAAFLVEPIQGEAGCVFSKFTLGAGLIPSLHLELLCRQVVILRKFGHFVPSTTCL